MTEHRINWYRSNIDRDKLRSLTTRSDLKGLLQCGGFLLVYLCTVAFSTYLFLQRMWVAMAIVCYVHAIFHSFIGMEAAVHELSHGTPFKTKWLNEFFYFLFSFLTWNNGVHFRVSHMKHHQFTVHHGLDKEVILGDFPFNVWDYISWFFFDYKRFATIMYPNIAHFFGKAEVDVFSWDPLFQPDDPQSKSMVRWARFMVIGHAALVAVFIYFQLWVLIFTVTLGYFFATFLAHGTGMMQHLGLRPNVPDWRVSCHTVIFDPVNAFLYWNMNYHIEHHMYGAVPFYNLKKLHHAIKKDLPEPAHGYTGGLSRILRIQIQQARDPEYIFHPVFPDTATPPRTEAS